MSRYSALSLCEVCGGQKARGSRVPWWRVVRELELHPYLPAWIAS